MCTATPLVCGVTWKTSKKCIRNTHSREWNVGSKINSPTYSVDFDGEQWRCLYVKNVRATYRKLNLPFHRALTWKGQDPMYSDEHEFSILFSTLVTCNKDGWIWKSTLNSPRLIPPFLQTFERSSSVLSQFSLLFSREDVRITPWKNEALLSGTIYDAIDENDNYVLCTTGKTNIGITFDIRSKARASLCPTNSSS